MKIREETPIKLMDCLDLGYKTERFINHLSLYLPFVSNPSSTPISIGIEGYT